MLLASMLLKSALRVFWQLTSMKNVHNLGRFWPFFFKNTNFF